MILHKHGFFVIVEVCHMQADLFIIIDGREIGNLLAACLGDFFSGSYLNMHLNEV